MSKIPNAEKYAKPLEGTVHPRIAERRYKVQQERLVDGMFANGGLPVDELLGDKWKELDE